MSRTIFTEEVLVVIQEWRGGSRPEYDLFDQHWRQIGVARRAAPGGLKKVWNALDGDSAPGPLQVVDMRGTLLLTTARGWERGRPVALIRDGNGREIGKVIRMRGILKPEFDLEHGGRRIRSVKFADRRQRVANVSDAGGTAVGEIRTITKDTPLPLPEGTEGYYLKTHVSLTEPLRSLVIACTVALQSLVSTESMTASFSVTFPGLPALFDRLRQRSRS